MSNATTVTLTPGSVVRVKPGDKIEQITRVRVPRRGLYFDFRNDAGKAEMLARDGWASVLDRYAWPHLSKGDRLVIRFPGTRTGAGELARWADVWVNVPVMMAMQDAATKARAVGVELCLYIRRPSNEDLHDGGADAAKRLGRVVATLECVRGVTWIIDGAYEEGVPLNIACPWGARLLELFSELGGRVAVEPAWPAMTSAPMGWGWEWPCVVTDVYYQRMKREAWKAWRPWAAGLPEIMRVQPGMAGLGKDAIVAGLRGFLAECAKEKHAPLVFGDLFTDLGISWKDVAAG